ncbi:MAG: mechanosensitive ion channel family protein [Gemmatimonadaceae bacterium]|nr:mechanosensitive ion channel family protein [Gemmatimonadaceae bacterium]
MRRFSLISCFLLLPAVLGAQLLQRPTQPPDSAVDSVPPVVVDSASPRAAVTAFLQLTRSANYERAAGYLELTQPEYSARGEDLARRLKAVLDSKLWIDLERVSPVAIGDTADGLPRNREELGVIPADGDREVAIRLARIVDGNGRRWAFSQATVSEVDGLYEALPDNWIREHLPLRMLNEGPFDILYWQWIALLVLVPIAALAGLTLSAPTRSLLKKLVSRTDTDFDDKLVDSARGPLILLWGVVASRVLLRWIALAAPAQAFVVDLQTALATVALFWILLRAIGVLQDDLPGSKWTESHPALKSLIPLAARIGRIVVLFIGVLTIISQFGYPIATILAGLGIGGIAIALGAQKSLEHFFGSVSIGVDQPFAIGDWVKVGEVAGSIEAIGLRSTRIRTMDRTLVSIPNGQLSESQTENFGQRDRIRLAGVLGVEYGTSAATMRLLRDGIEKILRAHPLCWQERVQVAFSNFGAYSLDIEFFCWLETTQIDEFRAARHELFLQMMEFVEGNGAGFAFPTQTVHVLRPGDPTQGS